MALHAVRSIACVLGALMMLFGSTLRAEEPDLPWLGEPSASAPTRGEPAHDFGFPRGRCHAEMLAGVLGGALGGFMGSRIGDGDRRLAAAAAGSVIGYILGSAIGRGIDEMDETCVGQVLERAKDEQTVAFVDSRGQGRYEVTPVRTFQHDERHCRDYVYDALVDGASHQGAGTACREATGRWQPLR